jgi:hypothetical protein
MTLFVSLDSISLRPLHFQPYAIHLLLSYYPVLNNVAAESVAKRGTKDPLRSKPFGSRDKLPF